MRTARAGESVIDTVDDFITALMLREPQATEAEAIKLLWCAIDHLERFGVTWEFIRNAATDGASIILDIEKVPALQRRTVYYLKSENEGETAAVEAASATEHTAEKRAKKPAIKLAKVLQFPSPTPAIPKQAAGK